MDSMASSQPSKATPKKPSSSSLPSPMKPPAAVPSPAKVGISEQIETPEKLVELPRRGRSQRVAYSVKEVKRIAQGLQNRGREVVSEEWSGDLTMILRLWRRSLSEIGLARLPSQSSPVKLPEKYEKLVEFFNCMESSIRLLRLKGATSTFSNICSSVQHLSDRKFTCGHLAQLKYVFPEAISIKKVLVHDEVSCCMKPELQVSLQIDAVGKNEKQNGESGYSLLRKVFRERLVEFSKEHPKEDDIPEEELPHPFNKTNPTLPPNPASASMNLVHSTLPSNTINQQQLTAPSHMPQSFQRRFSRKTPIPDAEKTCLACTDKLPEGDPLLSLTHHQLNAPQNSHSCHLHLSTWLNHGDASNVLCENEVNNLEETPSKDVSTPARLMTSTPEIPVPQRYCSTSMLGSPPMKKRSARTKLFQTPTKHAKIEDEELEAPTPSANNDVISFLPEALLQSIREKEKKILMEKETGAAAVHRREKIIASLPDMFNLIHLLFQSGNRSTMTKQELIYKIIAGHRKIVDRSEIEEQLKLFQEIVPDWISEKITSSGDALVRVNKICAPEEIRQRLAEAE
ncbi:LOW QUALITY PROTEIN: CDT1-like protein a, chloroplastic [Dioscorea cayenensis subsp. rotundata]|uniref:LOW QUALITY PROTEIN: CDT1-like protein a, chloroplastic n=1 Tax=Dioscorea cayennensis subsp. rotundata TaxID=55577 RepID=A0AB40BZB4_DIOCR|nr:LOW QUALITY PROTEIN: CDT1-like protein a, chloroplastic [Dioscorea cayenensis subsp. rotundata]